MSNQILKSLALVLAIAAPIAVTAQPPTPPPAGPHAEPMPELLWPPERPENADYRWPYFVHVERVLKADGSLDTEIIDPNAADGIQRQFLDKEPETPCIERQIPGEPHMSRPHWQDFLDIVDELDFVVIARVTGSSKGFVAEKAGTLLRLEPIQWLKGLGTWDGKFLFFPAADLSLGGKDFCVTHVQYPINPVEHERVLIAYADNFVNRDYPWLGAYPAATLVLQAEGRTQLPLWLRKRQPEWARQPAQRIVGEIRRHLQRSHGQQP